MPKFFNAGQQASKTPFWLLWEGRFRASSALVVLVFILVGCTATPIFEEIAPTATPTPEPQSAWGRINTLAQAERLDAPALHADAEMAFAWTGTDANGVRMFAQTRGVTRPLAIDSFFPFDEMLFPAAQGGYHLLWLDRTAQDEALFLQSARFSRDAIAELGANPVSLLPARRYSAVSLPDNSVQVVWSSVSQNTPDLYATTLDPDGRIAFAERIEPEGDYPALVYTDAAIHLFWLEADGQQAYAARLVDNQLVLKRPLAYLDGLRRGDFVENFQVSMTETHLYIFWQIRRSAGERDIWYTSGALDNFAPLHDPHQLRVITNMPDDVDLPRFDTYSEMALAYGVQARFLSTLPAATEPLPLAVQAGSELGLAYFQAGRLVGYQRVVETELILGQPNFALDDAGHFYLAWADSRQLSTADLLWTTNRESR